MSQKIQQLKIKKGFTKTFKQLTFKFPLQRNTLVQLQNKNLLCDSLFNYSQINLSGANFQNWAYSGNILLTDAEAKQIQKNLDIQLVPTNNSFKECDSQQSKKQRVKNFKALNLPFMILLQSSKWQIARINMLKSKNQIKKIPMSIDCDYVQFSKLLKLQLMHSNLHSIQFLQTLQMINLQQLHLRFNRITNIKSMQKVTCQNLRLIDLSFNFLNSDKTFEGLTKLNAQKLRNTELHCQNKEVIFDRISYQRGLKIGKKGEIFLQKYNEYDLIQLHCQNNERIFKKVQQYDNFQTNRQRQQNPLKYNKNNKTYTLRNYIFSDIQQQSKLTQQQMMKLFNKNTIMQIIDYLIESSLDFIQFRFCLKSKFVSYLLNSPYDYFLDFGTDPQALREGFQQLTQRIDEQKRQEYEQLWKPCILNNNPTGKEKFSLNHLWTDRFSTKEVSIIDD